MKNFEYMYFKPDGGTYTLIDEMNKLGAEGWEAFNWFEPSWDGGVRAVTMFKREITNNKNDATNN